MKRQAAERRGRRAEIIAAWWLRLQGWHIVAQRLRTPRGEIDLIARRGKRLCFIEVKARDTREALDLAIDERRLKRVAAAADAVAHHYARDGDSLQIDVILIAPGRLPRHMKNIWHG